MIKILVFDKASSGIVTLLRLFYFCVDVFSCNLQGKVICGSVPCVRERRDEQRGIECMSSVVGSWKRGWSGCKNVAGKCGLDIVNSRECCSHQIANKKKKKKRQMRKRKLNLFLQTTTNISNWTFQNVLVIVLHLLQQKWASYLHMVCRMSFTIERIQGCFFKRVSFFSLR